MIHLAKRVIRQTINDKRSVMMILFAPLLILTLVYFLLGDSDYIPSVGIDRNTLPEPLLTALEEQNLTIKQVQTQDANSYLKANPDIDAILTFSSDGQIFLDAYEPSTKASLAVTTIQKAFVSLNPSAEIKTSYLYGDKTQSTFDRLGYVFLALFSFFLVFIISAMALVRERSGGTLERLLMTPIQRAEVIMGYILGYGVFAIVQSILIVLYSIYILNLSLIGNIGWILLTMILLAVTAVSFGATISIFAQSELQVVQMIPFTIIPQVFFSGLIPLDLIPYHLGNLSYVMPIYYGASAIKEVMIYGGGFFEIWGYLGGLVLFTLLLIIINSHVLKRFRES